MFICLLTILSAPGKYLSSRNRRVHLENTYRPHQDKPGLNTYFHWDHQGKHTYFHWQTTYFHGDHQRSETIKESKKVSSKGWESQESAETSEMFSKNISCVNISTCFPCSNFSAQVLKKNPFKGSARLRWGNNCENRSWGLVKWPPIRNEVIGQWSFEPKFPCPLAELCLNNELSHTHTQIHTHTRTVIHTGLLS